MLAGLMNILNYSNKLLHSEDGPYGGGLKAGVSQSKNNSIFTLLE